MKIEQKYFKIPAYHPSMIYGAMQEKFELANTTEAANQLISHVLLGKESEAIAMIEANPDILLHYGTAKDYSGRSYEKVTAFQAAVLIQDRWMWKKILPLFETITLEDDQLVTSLQIKFRKVLSERPQENYSFESAVKLIIAMQLHEIFSNGLPFQTPYDFLSLDKTIENSSDEDITAALEKKDNNSELSKALQTFREKFTQQSVEEKFYNFQHIIKIHELCNRVDRPNNKQQLLWSQVLGFVQRFVPTWYAQSCSQGLFDVAFENQALIRSLKIIKDGQDIDYYPLPTDSGLGYDFGIQSDFGDNHCCLQGMFMMGPYQSYAALLSKKITDELRALLHQYPLNELPTQKNTTSIRALMNWNLMQAYKRGTRDRREPDQETCEEHQTKQAHF